ncbi:MAG: hypothetical protein R3E42_17840 [Burkholderiaceae bacterium]
MTPHISTRWKDRLASLTPMADVMAQQFDTEPGNYLAFFSSFSATCNKPSTDCRNATCCAHLVPITRHDNPTAKRSSPDLPTPARALALRCSAAPFGRHRPSRPTPHRRLHRHPGPAADRPVNEQMRARLQQRFGRGYDYAYLYPGLQKVVQAAGRMIHQRDGPGDGVADGRPLQRRRRFGACCRVVDSYVRPPA